MRELSYSFRWWALLILTRACVAVLRTIQMIIRNDLAARYVVNIRARHRTQRSISFLVQCYSTCSHVSDANMLVPWAEAMYTIPIHFLTFNAVCLFFDLHFDTASIHWNLFCFSVKVIAHIASRRKEYWWILNRGEIFIHPSKIKSSISASRCEAFINCNFHQHLSLLLV